MKGKRLCFSVIIVVVVVECIVHFTFCIRTRPRIGKRGIMSGKGHIDVMLIDSREKRER